MLVGYVHYLSVAAVLWLLRIIPAAHEASVKKAKRYKIYCPDSRVIRLEWDSTNTFTDNASFTVVNRYLLTPKYSTRQKMDGTIFKLMKSS